MQDRASPEYVARAMAEDVEESLLAQDEEYKQIHGHYKTEEEALDEVFENHRLMGFDIEELLPELRSMYQKWLDEHPDVQPD